MIIVTKAKASNGRIIYYPVNAYGKEFIAQFMRPGTTGFNYGHLRFLVEIGLKVEELGGADLSKTSAGDMMTFYAPK